MFARMAVLAYKFEAILEGLKTTLISFTEPLARIGQFFVNSVVTPFNLLKDTVSNVISGNFSGIFESFRNQAEKLQTSLKDVGTSFYKTFSQAQDTFNTARIAAERKALAEIRQIYAETASVQLDAQKSVVEQLLADSRNGFEQKKRLIQQEQNLEIASLQQRLRAAKEVYDAELNMLKTQQLASKDVKVFDVSFLSKEDQEKLEKQKQNIINLQKDIEVSQIRHYQALRDLKREQLQFELDVRKVEREGIIAANEFIISQQKATLSEEL